MLTKFKKLAKDWAGGERKKFSRKIKEIKTLTMCERCFAFYYKNSWHLKKPNYLSEDREEEISVLFTQCVACLEQEEALYQRESNSDLVLG